MGAQIIREVLGPISNAYRVTCPEHGLNRLVLTPEHADNLLRMHDRIDHADEPPPETFDITAAATAVLGLQRGAGGDAADAALMVWQALTGRDTTTDEDDEAALQLARDYADSPTTAHTAPF